MTNELLIALLRSALEVLEPEREESSVFASSEPVSEYALGRKDVEPEEPSVPAPGPECVETAELDGLGYSWDARIHVSTKTKMKSDGSWKLKPRVSPELVAQVRAETMPAVEPTPTSPDEPNSVIDLAQYLAERVGDGRLTQDAIDAALAASGVKQLIDYRGHEHMIPDLIARLK